VPFKVGEKVIYPGRGICEIERISTQEVDGRDVEFYHLTFLRDEATVMVPVEKADTIGIRRLLDKAEVPKVYAFLRQNIHTPSSDYKVRYQQNVDRLASGTIFDIADVVKTLVYLSRIKKLSERETNMLERAYTLLVNEIAQVSGADKDEVQSKVDRALEQFDVEE